jgi:Fur family zinc uptake transcriptional regulator
MTRDPETGPADAGVADVAPGFRPHDHAACVSTALAAAEARSTDEGLRLTPVRRKVLEILVQEHRALGAYALLDKLREAGFGSQPPVAYRALEFLTRHGFAHKIERLNAFVACSHPGPNHAPAFMICRICDAVAEAQASPADGGLGDAAEAVGFRIEKTVVEAEGVCPACRARGASDAGPGSGSGSGARP